MGLCGGVPMLCWPFFAEQQTNCRYKCVELGGDQFDEGCAMLWFSMLNDMLDHIIAVLVDNEHLCTSEELFKYRCWLRSCKSMC